MHRLRLFPLSVLLSLVGCSSGLVVTAPSPLGAANLAAPPAGPHLAPTWEVATPWPRVLPCEVFSELTFEVFDPGGLVPAEPKALAWQTGDGRSLPFSATRSGPAQVADATAVGPSFPSRALSRLALPLTLKTVKTGQAEAVGERVNIWLQCAGSDGSGIEWVCARSGACAVGVVYPPASAPSWPAALDAGGALATRIDRLLERRHGRAGEVDKATRGALQPIIRELALATRAWLDVACSNDRCPQAIVVAGVRLGRFVASPALKITRAHQREVLDNEHYRAGYPRIEVDAEAGGETVSLSWDVATDWRLSFGEAGAGRVTCTSDGCTTDDVSVGTTLDFHFYHRDGFGILGPPLAMR